MYAVARMSSKHKKIFRQELAKNKKHMVIAPGNWTIKEAQDFHVMGYGVTEQDGKLRVSWA